MVPTVVVVVAIVVVAATVVVGISVVVVASVVVVGISVVVDASVVFVTRVVVARVDVVVVVGKAEKNGTATGRLLLSCVLLPSWPKSFRPQHNTSPAGVIAQA
jgi:hypothetical protein